MPNKTILIDKDFEDISSSNPVPVQSVVSASNHRATAASGAINSTLTPSGAFQLLEIRLHLSDVGAAGSFTVTLDSGTNAVYDVVLVTQDLTSVKDYIFQPDFPMVFDSGDKLVFAFPNGANRTYGLEVKYKAL